MRLVWLPMDLRKTRELVKSAKEKGAQAAKIIPAKDVAVEDFVLLKCKYGCRDFGKFFTCPPYTPKPQETRELLRKYKWAMLVEFRGMTSSEFRRKTQTAMADLEREAFLGGLHRAFAYAPGSCKICETCPAGSLANPCEFSQRECRDPARARPSMESCGIDVFSTVRKAGFKINTVKGYKKFKNYGLLLLE